MNANPSSTVAAWIDLKDNHDGAKLKLASLVRADGQKNRYLVISDLSKTSGRWARAQEALGFAASAQGNYLSRLLRDNEVIKPSAFHAVWPNATRSEMALQDIPLNLPQSEIERVIQPPLEGKPEKTENANPTNEATPYAARQLDQPSPPALERTPASDGRANGEQGNFGAAAHTSSRSDSTANADTGRAGAQPAASLGDDPGAFSVSSRGALSKRADPNQLRTEGAAGIERRSSLPGNDGRGDRDLQSPGRVEGPAGDITSEAALNQAEAGQTPELEVTDEEGTAEAGAAPRVGSGNLGADGVDAARKPDDINARDFGKAKLLMREATNVLAAARKRREAAGNGTIEQARAQLDSNIAIALVAKAGVLGYPYTSGPEYQARVDNLESAHLAVKRTEDRINSALERSQNPDRASRQESQAEKSEREFGENYNRVANTDDLSTVSARDIARAISWASRTKQSEARKGWNGGQVNENILSALDSEIVRLKAEEARRVNATQPTQAAPAEIAQIQAPQNEPAQAPVNPTDFVIEEDFALGVGGQKTKYRQNIDAIRLLKKLQGEDRLATPDEQAVLAKYVGWGGLAQAFDEDNQDWAREFAELRQLLTGAEYAEARRSTRYAHYTSRPIISAMYEALRLMGFTGGKILEAGAGAGNFMGLMPADLRASSRMTGVEREPIASGIAKLLYPNQNMQMMDFTAFQALDGYFDANIGNPPFAADPLVDQSGRKHLSGFAVHDYFFAKSIDMLRDGGLFAAVVSNGFLDKKGDKARKYIGGRAKLLGAIRLPNNAFSKNANTEVTTDIVFFQKLPESQWGSQAAKQDLARWLDTALIPDPKGGEPIAINQYFADNPSMMLGEYGRFGSMYGPDKPALVARPGQDTEALLNEAVTKLPQGIYVPAWPQNPQGADQGVESDSTGQLSALHDTTVDEGGYYVEDGNLYQRMQDRAGEPSSRLLTPQTQWTEKTKLGETKYQRLVQLAALRKTMRQLLAAETADDNAMTGLRQTLNEQYEAYVRAHGLINDITTSQVFIDDPDYPLLAALELDYERGMGAAAAKSAGIAPFKSKAKKAPIFERRVIEKRAPVQKAKSPEDALNVSIAERGKVDVEYIGLLLDRPGHEVLESLTMGERPLLFVDPATGQYVLRDAYLSGNVRKKLRQAQEAGADSNARALLSVQPEDVGAHEISAKLGAPWILTDILEDFAKHLLGEGTKADIRYMPLNSSFSTQIRAGSNAFETVLHGTPDMPASRIFDCLLNNRVVRVTYTDHQGKVHVDKEKTDAANEKAQDIKAKFQDWLFADPDRSNVLVRAYNDTNNNYVTRSYDGSYLTFEGKVPDSIIKFRRNQRNAIARIIQERTALLDHVVGAGKTFEIIAAAMELKRTGLAKKPMIPVPNHLVKQWATDFYRLYPGANILTATKKDFARENRRRFLAKIATGNWDAVIIAHSSFGFIQPDPDFEIAFNEQQVAQVMRAIEQTRAEGAMAAASRRTVKQLEGMKERLENRIKSLRDRPVDNLLDFKQIGVDQLFVDEAHNFKNLAYATKMQNVRGLGDAKGSQRAYDMYLKVNQIFAQNGRGQGVVFATGTPVSNSMAEMYHMMRYLMPQAMEDGGFSSFDGWANTFAEINQVWMQKPSGDGYKAVETMGTFSNVHELLKMFDQVSDTVTMDDIKKAYSEENDGRQFPLPKLTNGKRTPISLEKSPAQLRFMESIAMRASALEKRKGKPKKGQDNHLSIMSDARKAAMDIRLVDMNVTKREKGARIDRASDEVVKRYHQFDSVKGTQLVFSDLGTPLSSAKKELKEYEALQARIAPLQDEDLAASAALGDEAAMRKIEDAEEAQEELDAKGGDWLGAVQAAIRGFSVYNDLKDALIEKGIAANEIAFIHDYNTDDQKAGLFRNVNSGAIRVLIGSTPKMGAGTNVQERLVALHHLDVPWRPSDIEQREGRIIRQGNKLIDLWPNFEIEILAYVTQDTLDMRMWQTQEIKLKMINQLRTRQISREIENPFEEAEMSAGEMQAAATGNVDMLAEIQLRNDVKKLEQRHRSFHAQRNDLLNRKRSAKERIEHLPQQIQELAVMANAAEEYLGSVNEREFKVLINGTEFNSRAQAEDEFRRLTSMPEQYEVYERSSARAKLSVNFNGKAYTSKTALGEALVEFAGDRDPLAWVFNGTTFNRRTLLAKAIEDRVMAARTRDAAYDIGKLGAFEIKVEGARQIFQSDVWNFDISATVGSRTESITVTADGASSRAQSDAVIRGVERMICEFQASYKYSQFQLQQAEKSAADLSLIDMPETWPEQSLLEAKRAQHKALLARMSGSDKTPGKTPETALVDETSVNELEDENLEVVVSRQRFG